jgi:hypothetical protein
VFALGPGPGRLVANRGYGRDERERPALPLPSAISQLIPTGFTEASFRVEISKTLRARSARPTQRGRGYPEARPAYIGGRITPGERRARALRPPPVQQSPPARIDFGASEPVFALRRRDHRLPAKERVHAGKLTVALQPGGEPALVHPSHARSRVATHAQRESADAARRSDEYQSP